MRFFQQPAKVPSTGRERPGIRQFLAWFGQAILLQLLWWSVAWMSPERASALGRRVMSWLGPRLKKSRHILANMRTAFPEKTPEEHAELTRQIWGSFGAVLVEYAHFDQLVDADREDPYVEEVFLYGDGSPLVDDVPRIFFTAHIGNWELSTFPARNLKRGLTTIYTPQNNPLLEAMIQKKRDVLGVGFTGRVNGLRALYHSIRKGQSTGLVADSRVDEGPLVPLFGHPAPTTSTLAWLSLKTGAEIVPVQIERLADARYRVTVHPGFNTIVEDGENETAAIERVTAEINRIIEGWITRDPGQWWCNKHRWSKDLMRELGAYD